MALAIPQNTAARNNIRRLTRPASNNIRLLRKTAQAANNIRRYVRPGVTVGGRFLLGKLSLAVTAFEVGYSIGTFIRKRLIDTSQPKPKPQPSFDENTYLLGPANAPSSSLPTRSISFVLNQRITHSGKKWCRNNETFEPGGDYNASSNSGKRVGGTATNARWRFNPAKQTVKCGPNANAPSQMTFIVEVLYSDNKWYDSNWKFSGLDVTWAGTRYSNYSMSSGTVYNTVEGLLIDNEPVPIPEPPVRPEPETEPELEPEAAPKPLPVIIPTRTPIQVPTRTDPLPETDPQRETPKKPVIAPPTIKPAIPPEKQPATKPGTIVDTNKDGQIKPGTPKPVPVTDPRDHYLGENGGGRIAGRTASANPVQIAQEVARIEQKTANLSKGNMGGLNLGDLLNLVRALLDVLTATTPGTTYKLQAVCECAPDAQDCEEPEMVKEIPPVFWGDASIARLDAIAEMLQPLKTWKQPICETKIPQEGNWRTIQFKSDEEMPSGRRYLTKTFRYRSKGSQLLENVVNHWKDFVWEAGPVCVINKGLWWGVPQVWAASEAEGKRVIQHAAAEAGISLEKSEWVISSSKNPRYGNTGTMRVRIYRNAQCMWYGITNRDNSDARPLVQEYLPPIRAVAIDNVNEQV